MAELPELDDFRRRIRELVSNEVLSPHVDSDEVYLSQLSIEDVRKLLEVEEGQYFLMAAANLNRTSLKKSMKKPEAQVVSPSKRRAYAIRERLPVQDSFERVASSATTLRRQDVTRKRRSSIEQLFRDRLAAEGIPLLMSPPLRQVPGLLIPNRKPDGIYPDPSDDAIPEVYLEIKNLGRVSDDIQKRLYELAEASLEMKLMYGGLRLQSLGITSLEGVAGNSSLRRQVRDQIAKSNPAVVGLFLCPQEEAERYREGAETFIDRLFFQEEIEDCLAFLRERIGTS